MSRQEKNWFELREAAQLSGLKRPMVDYLCRQGILIPSGPKNRGRGRPRQYSFGDVVVLRVLATLLRAGVSVARLKRGLVSLRRHHPEITPTSLPARYLVSDGRHIYLRHDENVVEGLDTTGQFSFAFVLHLDHLRREVLTQLRAKSA